MFRNRVALLILLSWVLFWPVAWFFPRMELFDMLNAIGVSLGAFVLWSYLPGVIEAIRHPQGSLHKGHYLILGIFATWLAMIARTGWLWGWRYFGEPPGGLDHIMMAFIAWTIVSGGVLHLLAPKVLNGVVPRATKVHLFIALAVGIILGATIALLRHLN